MLIPYYSLNCADKSYLVTRLLEDTLYHICNRSLTLCSGNTYGLKLISRIAVIIGCDISHRIAGVLNTDYRNVGFIRYVNLPAYDNSSGPGLHGIPDRRVAVEVGSNDTHEETALFKLSVIIDHLCYLSVLCAPYYFKFYAVKQFTDFHKFIPLYSLKLFLYPDYSDKQNQSDDKHN